MRRRPPRLPLRAALSAALLLPALAGTALAVLLPGDLNGDGRVDAADEALLVGMWGAYDGDWNFDPAADFNGDGEVDALDLALFGATFGAAGGEVDTAPPGLFVSLNHIPDDMNDLLVAPPDGFQITIDFDTGGGSIIDRNSLLVVKSESVDLGLFGSYIASNFYVTYTGAAWEVPAGSDLARTSHYLTVSVRDAAGNQASQSYGFAVRDFGFGPPLGNLQRIFLDFDRDRSLGPEIDFLEDLREYGLSSANPLPGAAGLEAQMRDRLVSEIVARVHGYYGRNPDGSPGADPVNIVFAGAPPTPPYSRLCVGGASSQGGSYLGAASIDLNNLNEASDECAIAAQFGIFPQAIDDLWGGNDEYQAAFHPLDPGVGGVPVGESQLDALVLAPGFDPATATAAQAARLAIIENAIDAFAQTVASATAHETGHMLGLTAPNAAPEGLWGSSGNHNLTVSGYSPTENFLMNSGGSFSFEEISGRGGLPLPFFRPLNWAYLRDRLVLDKFVQGLFPAPTLAAVDPPVITFSTGGQNRIVKFIGTNFIDSPFPELPLIELIRPGGGSPDPVFDVAPVVGDPSCCVGCCMTGRINKFFVSTVVYDVHLVNGDGQEIVLDDGLEVQ